MKIPYKSGGVQWKSNTNLVVSNENPIQIWGSPMKIQYKSGGLQWKSNTKLGVSNENLESRVFTLYRGGVINLKCLRCPMKKSIRIIYILTPKLFLIILFNFNFCRIKIYCHCICKYSLSPNKFPTTMTLSEDCEWRGSDANLKNWNWSWHFTWREFVNKFSFCLNIFIVRNSITFPALSLFLF